MTDIELKTAVLRWKDGVVADARVHASRWKALAGKLRGQLADAIALADGLKAYRDALEADRDAWMLKHGNAVSQRDGETRRAEEAEREVEKLRAQLAALGAPDVRRCVACERDLCEVCRCRPTCTHSFTREHQVRGGDDVPAAARQLVARFLGAVDRPAAVVVSGLRSIGARLAEVESERDEYKMAGRRVLAKLDEAHSRQARLERDHANDVAQARAWMKECDELRAAAVRESDEARAQVAELQALAIAGRDLSSEEFWKMWWQRLEVEHDRDQALARLAEAELERRELAKERTDSIDHARRWKALAVSFWAERNRAREQLATRSAS